MCGVWTLVIVVLYVVNFPSPLHKALVKSEQYAHDLRALTGRRIPADSRLVLIGIDKATYADDLSEDETNGSPLLATLTGRFPWTREVWAALIERLAESGAKVIALDIVFANIAPGDERLRSALEKYKERVVIGANFADSDSDRGGSLMLQLPNVSVLPTAASDLVYEDDRVGFVNIWEDEDEIFRHARFRLTSEQTAHVPEGQAMESLPARMLRKAGHAQTIPSGTDRTLFRFSDPCEILRMYEVFIPKYWDNNYQGGKFFRDKIVIIGPTANIFQDVHMTPLLSMPGPEIHLNIVNAALHGELLRETSLTMDLILIGLTGLAVWLLCLWIRQPVKRLLVIICLSGMYWILCQQLYNRANLVVVAVSPLLVLNLNGISALAYDFIRERLEKQRTRRTLERYVSKNIVKEILDNPATYLNALGGVRKPVTILFSDVRGFTSMTEGADSAQLVSQLNEYFSEMVRHVFEHHGTLDKFIGDAVMAVWGNIVTHGPETDARNAVAAALGMRRSLAELNQKWKAQGWPELSFGIGINHGEAIVGNIGSSEKMELTVIGDAVNLASRLEGLTKEYHVDLLVGDTVAALVRDRFLLRAVDYVQVKGKTKAAEVSTVVCERGTSQEQQEAPWLKVYEQGIGCYRRMAFADGVRAFKECLRLKPGDYLGEVYLKRCQDLLEKPPDKSWTGITVMTRK